jgi:redox-sensing transcriptional repressor
MRKLDMATVTRLPQYHQILQKMKHQGREYVSSEHLAQIFHVDANLVRKDLAFLTTGVQKLGYPVLPTIEKIEEFLGMRNAKEAFLIGAGWLGHALMTYQGFKQYGLKITAAFDSDQAKVGGSVGEVKVLPIEKLRDLMPRMNIKIGIITVPADAAQEVADLLVESGALAIWNFAPVNLQLPPRVIVKNENLAASYALLSYDLEKILSRQE